MYIIGIDEVGRGCLSGPVVAAAVAMNSGTQFSHSFALKDSKLLSANTRELLAQKIKHEFEFAIGWSYPHEIDTINIHHASLLAMERACNALVHTLDQKKFFSPLRILVDGKFTPNIKCEHDYTISSLVKGDSYEPHIQAASILAKTVRDDHIALISCVYPMYGFDKHKGYPTPLHKKCIQIYGICSVHRKSFKLFI